MSTESTDLVKPSKKIFSSVYSKVYSLYNYKIEFTNDVITIMRNNNNIPSEEISELIDYITQSKIKKKAFLPINTSECGFLGFEFFKIILPLICDYELSAKDVNELVIFISKTNGDNTHNELECLNKLVDSGHVFTKEQLKILDKKKYRLPIKLDSTPKITQKDFLKIFETKGGVEIFFKNINAYSKILKNSKITVDSKLFVKMTSYNFNSLMCCLNSDQINDIINFCTDNGYKFNLDSMIYLSYGNTKGLTKIIELLEKYGIDKVVFFKIGIFVDPLLLGHADKEKYINLISPEICISASHHYKNNPEIIKYYTNKKYIGTANDLILSFYYYLTCRQSNYYSAIFDHLIQTGSTITPPVFEYICLSDDIYEKYKHLFVGTEKERIDIEKKMNILRKNLTQKYYTPKTISSGIAKSEDIFLEICQKNTIGDIVTYCCMYNMEITSDVINALFLNENMEVIQYTINRYNVIPSLANILSHKDFLMRYTLGKIYYPEIFNLKHNPTVILPVNCSNSTKINNLNDTDDVPKKIKKEKKI